MPEPGLTLPGPRLRLAGSRPPAFWVLGVAGIGSSVAVAMTLSTITGLSPAVQLAICLAAIATFAGLWRAEGRRLVYYHHHLAVMTIAGLLAALLGAPVVAHLDATAVGLCVFLACGRAGCLLAGCCHGRPADRGVTYGEAHVAAGFPPWLAGVALAPVQALEAVGAALLAGMAGAAMLGGPAGAGLVVSGAGYAALRFWMEPLRGDFGRLRLRGLSEAQWTSLALATGLLAAAESGILAWPGVPFAALVAVATAAVLRRVRPPHPLEPARIREALDALGPALTGPAAAAPMVARTSCGVLLSAGWTGRRPHYSMSGATLGHRRARILARAILWHRHPGSEAEFVAGPAGVYHLVVNA